MPFNLFRRRGKEEAPASAAPAARPPGRKVRFDGLSEEWRLVGYMQITGRLSDALNRREPVELSDMRWASVVDGGPLEEAPGLRTIDPYDLIMVLAGEDSLPPLSDDERAALRLHKVPYDVALQLPPYRVAGRVFLFPGTEPNTLLERATDMFMPVTDAVATLEGRRVNDPAIDTILVNRFYLRGVEQLETGSATGDETTSVPVAAGDSTTSPSPQESESPPPDPADASPPSDEGARSAPSDLPSDEAGSSGQSGRASGEDAEASQEPVAS